MALNHFGRRYKLRLHYVYTSQDDKDTNYVFIMYTNYGFIIYTQVIMYTQARMTKLLVMLSVAVRRIRRIRVQVLVTSADEPIIRSVYDQIFT